MANTNSVSYENLEYGGYVLMEEGSIPMSENVKYGLADFNRLYIQKLRLPDGYSNIVYLLTDTFENSIKMINNRFFITPPSYRRYFYPSVLVGTFLNKRYRINVTKELKTRREEINKKTTLRAYALRSMPKSMDNTFFNTSDVYSALRPIIDKASVINAYMKFFPEFVNIITGLSPEVDSKLQEKKADSCRRIIMIDCEAFKFKVGASLTENKDNPLFLLYLAFLRTKDLSKLDIDIDMIICYKNMFLKFNPSKMKDSRQFLTFKRLLFRIIDANLDDYTDQLSDEEKSDIGGTPKDHTVDAIIDDVIDPYVKDVSTGTKEVLAGAIKSSLQKQLGATAAIDKGIKDAQKNVNDQLGVKNDKPEKSLFQQVLDKDKSFIHQNPTIDPLDPRREKLFGSIGKEYIPLATKSNLVIDDEDYEDYDKPAEETLDEDEEEAIRDDVSEILTDEEEIATEVMDEIQDKIAPLKNPDTAPVNSARDLKLREAQKKVMVKESSIEEILSQDAENVPIKSSDKSAVMHTSNKNMYNLRFTNFDKTYIDELMTKHIVACFDMLKDKDSPFYIRSIDVHDSSDSLNLKETWIVKLVDENKKQHTIRVDIPKFQNDKFMFIKGNRWIILKQNCYNPLVKDTPDTVIVTTNFNKITIRRKATKSISSVERLFSLVKKSGNSKLFITGDSSKGNTNPRFISSLEYDEIARSLFKFESNSCEIYFSREYLDSNMKDKVPSDIKGDEFFIGMEKNTPILINEDTGLDRMGRTIIDIIVENLPEDEKLLFETIKAPTQSMYVESKLAGEFVPIVVVLLVWVGITRILNTMGIYWKFDQDAKRVPQQTPSRKYIRFADGVLEYESKTFAELILNGISKLHPERFQFSDFNTESCYDEYVYSQWGSYNGITEIRNFYEFLIDPITSTVCKNIKLPATPEGLLIHAVKLLSDNKFVSKSSDKSYRTRAMEIIPGILYSCIANQYKAYVKSGRRIPMTLKQSCVIDRLIAEKTVEAYSTLNPVIEVSKTSTISTKGYRGSNSEHSYDEKKRSYDPTSVGKIAITTSADANVGINRELVVEPTIGNAMGYRDQVEDIETLKDVNVFSPVEMLTPGTARFDDPIRTAIASKQSQHVVPVIDAAPSLISNGYDEAVQFELSDDFVINAEEDGKVVDVNEELGFIVVQYKSGKNRAINLRPDIVKNSGGGFYMKNQLKPTRTKIGEKFKKDEPLAYHENYFKYSEMNGLRYAIGPRCKVAFMSTYNTYEDAGISTEEFGERMASSIVYQELGKFKRNNNILAMVKVGDHVNIGDSLIKFDLSTDDNELAKYLTKLSDENAALLEEQTKNDIKAGHAGTVVDIKVYTLLDPSNLSPSLANIVQRYFDQGINKKKYLEKFDNSEGIIKAGYMLTDSTEPIKSPYNAIKGVKGVDVLIEIYIEHKDVMGVGDKIALYSANKQIVSQVIPKGWEPYSEFRPDEHISVITSPGTVARRMTSSVIPVAAGMKCLVELKRKIADMIKYG